MATKAAHKVRPNGYILAKDLSELTLPMRRSLLPKLRKARDEGKIAYSVLHLLILNNRVPTNRQESASEETERSFTKS